MMIDRMKMVVAIVLGLVVLGFPLSGEQGPAGLVKLVDSLAGELDIAIEHTVLGRLGPDLKYIQSQAHQVLNVLVGRGGPGYDPQFPDPGNGTGLATYARRLAHQVADRDQRLRWIADNVLFFINNAIEQVRAGIRTGKRAVARDRLHRALAFLLAARGCPEDQPSEGGVRALQRLLRQGLQSGN